MVSKNFQPKPETLSFCLGFTSVRLPEGKGKGRKSGNDYNIIIEECSNRKGIVCIKNKDNLCLPRALVTGVAQRNNDSNYAKLRRDDCKIQSQKALELLSQTEVTVPDDSCSFPELRKFQEFLKIIILLYTKMIRKARGYI